MILHVSKTERSQDGDQKVIVFNLDATVLIKILGERAPVVASIHAIPDIIPDGITIEQLEALMCRVRIEELSRKINMSELDLDYTAERYYLHKSISFT